MTLARFPRPYGVTVKRADDERGFGAMAYDVDHAGQRRPIVNDAGLPLIAYGRTPTLATAHLIAALKRRAHRAAHVAPPRQVLDTLAS